VGGAAALVGVLVIMVILIAVLALIVVKALAESPWGVFSIAMTIPIALFMGCYLRFLRPGKVGEVSALISDNGGHYVYKVVSKEVLPLDKVSNEIHNTLKTQRLKDGMEKYQNSYHTETNEAYFGPPQPMAGRPGMPPHMPHPPMGQPSAQPQGPGAGAATPQQAAPPANAPTQPNAQPAPSSKPN